LGAVLANEEDEGRLASFSVFRVAPPPGEVGVVAAELVVVLIGAAGAVVFDEEEPRALAAPVGDFEGGVRDEGAWLRVAEAFDGPVVVEPQLGGAYRPGWGDLVFAVPVDQRRVELSAVGEYPGVELDIVDGAAVVEDVPGFEAAVGVDDADVAE
jgi:hypothetical protein